MEDITQVLEAIKALQAKLPADVKLKALLQATLNLQQEIEKLKS